MVPSLGFRVQGAGFRVLKLGFQGRGFRGSQQSPHTQEQVVEYEVKGATLRVYESINCTHSHHIPRALNPKP